MALPRLTEEQIKEDAEQQLRKFKRTKDFLIAIDTDGCVTDNMNGKQMLIFHPQFLEFYQLWGIESYFREVAEYYNLFSWIEDVIDLLPSNLPLLLFKTGQIFSKYCKKEI